MFKFWIILDTMAIYSKIVNIRMEYVHYLSKTGHIEMICPFFDGVTVVASRGEWHTSISLECNGRRASAPSTAIVVRNEIVSILPCVMTMPLTLYAASDGFYS